jgi:hypothetical protein
MPVVPITQETKTGRLFKASLVTQQNFVSKTNKQNHSLLDVWLRPVSQLDGSRDQKDQSSEPAWAKNVRKTLSQSLIWTWWYMSIKPAI